VDGRNNGSREPYVRRAEQWAPWISGNRIVWVDQRDTPTGTLQSPDNPVDRPAVQHLPVVQGDWIVWMDTRNAVSPNAGFLTDRMEIWGYYFPTRSEYPIVTGDIRASNPSIVDGHVLLMCSPPNDNRGGAFVADLPTAGPVDGMAGDATRD
jgi:hypothetical protein